MKHPGLGVLAVALAALLPTLTPAQVTTDLFDVAQGTTVTTHTPVQGSNVIEDMFGAALGLPAPGVMHFEDGFGAGSVHSVEFDTGSAVAIGSIGLHINHDATTNRALDNFRLLAFNGATFDLVYEQAIPVPYPGGSFLDQIISIPTTVAQLWRAELTQATTPGDLGPRIRELDGYPCVPAPADLVSWWDGDAVAGVTASDIQDGNDGTLLNGVGSAAGQVGDAFSFDGTDDYISVPSAANLKPTAALTVDAWVRLSVDLSTQNDSACAVVKGPDAEAPIDWALCLTGNGTGDPGKVRPHVRLQPNSWHFFNCGTVLAANVWYHIAMTYDGADLRCYVNGAADGSLAVAGTLRTSNSALRIGAYAPVNGTTSKLFFLGEIDEVEFFDVALSQPDLQAIHDAGAAGKCKLFPTPTPTPTVTPTPTCTPLVPVGPTPTPTFGAKAAQKCQRTIAKEASKFVKAKTKALQKCEDAKVKDKHGNVCPDAGAPDGSPARKAFEKIGKAISKLSAKIAKACGGDNKTCGTGGDPDTGEEAPANLGFYTTCPNFEGGTCNFPVTDCADIADCVECIGEAAVDQAMSFYYGSLVDTDPDLAKALNKCQQTIGKETSKFLLAKEKIVLKCWDKILKGQGPGSGNDKVGSTTCPDLGGTPGLAAAKAALKLIKAESKKVAKLCKACGGPSKTCDLDIDTSLIVDGGNTLPGDAGPADDFSPAAIGFATTCPSVTLPVAPGTACDTLDDIDGAADTIDTLRELILCVDCVTEFKVDCIDASARPEYQPYACECQ